MPRSPARRTLYMAVTFALGAATASETLLAQGVGPRPVIEAAAVPDAQAELARLEQRVRADPRDAALWRQLGQVAADLAGYSLANDVRPPDPTRTARLADSSFRMATVLQPQSAEYRLALGAFLQSSNNGLTRTAALRELRRAVELSRPTPTDPIFIEAAQRLAWIEWRSAESVMNRRMEVVPGSAIRSILSATTPGRTEIDTLFEFNGPPPALTLKAVRDALETSTAAVPEDGAGIAQEQEAERLFAEVWRARPAEPWAFRSYAMTLANRNRWTELREAARTQRRLVPEDPWGLLAAGLALHRSGSSEAAAAHFDSAFAAMPSAQRERLDALTRIWPTTDTTRLQQMDPSARAAQTTAYWQLANPLWSRGVNTTRIEFLSRVVFAELRWSVPDQAIDGADTDRGRIHIRYGPPQVVANFAPARPQQNSVASYQGDYTIVWAYDFGLLFAFSTNPLYGTARLAVDDTKINQRFEEAIPVRWDNLASVTVDSIPTSIVRFRGTGDMVDVLMTTAVPAREISAAAEVAAPVRADLWLLNNGVQVTQHDSLMSATAAPFRWRVAAPPGDHVIRVEASADASPLAARGTALVRAGGESPDGFAVSGFGTSDLVIAARVETDAAAAARRWSDVPFVPILSGVEQGTTISLLWESYGLTARDGNARYMVRIELRRERGVVGRVGAAIIDAIPGLQVSARDELRMVQQFERVRPHADVVLDALSLQLSETPAGRYVLSVAITDAVAGKTATVSRELVVR
jgi:GWxTD domain-containing protein